VKQSAAGRMTTTMSAPMRDAGLPVWLCLAVAEKSPPQVTGNSETRHESLSGGNFMARKKPTAKAEFVLFNVLYEDGTLTSNRRVPGDVLGGLEGDEPARAILEAQDRQICERSGRQRSRIKSITRAAPK
jgi:hypothetical protein